MVGERGILRFPKDSMDEWNIVLIENMDATYLLLMVRILTINIILGCYIMVDTIVTINTKMLEITASRQFLQSL